MIVSELEPAKLLSPWMAMPAIVAAMTCGIPTALSWHLPATRRASSHAQAWSRRRGASLAVAAADRGEDLFWPSSPPSDGARRSGEDRGEEEALDEEERRFSAALDSVVKVYATHSEPDFLIPWQKHQQTTSTSSGFLLEVPGVGLRVATNAHSVEYGSVVQVQRRGDAEKHAAVVAAASCLRLGPLPALQDQVEVLGYPAGGDSLCVTKGVVSRVEMQEYAQAGERLLAMQIDAAINPGNSGGPVVNEHLEVVGVAFQGIDDQSIENVGYAVPSSVVGHFLEDVRRNGGAPARGFCRLGIDAAFLENEAFRKFLRLGSDVAPVGEGEPRRSAGIMVRRVEPTSGAHGVLRGMDVVVAVDGIAVGTDGKIPFRRGERVDLGGYITSLFEGDEVRMTIVREGRERDVSFPVSPIKSLVPSHFSNAPPPYLICSGLVFTALSVPYLEAKGAWSDFYTESLSYLLGLVRAPLEREGDEVVVLAQVLVHSSNLGYENCFDLHLLKFNDVAVRSLRHLKGLIDGCPGPFMAFEFAPLDGGRLIVLDRDRNDQVTEEICSEHSIGRPFVLRE